MMNSQFIIAAMLVLPLACPGDQTAQKKSVTERAPKSARKIPGQPQQKPGWLLLPPQTSSPKLRKIVTRSAFPIGGKRQPRTADDFKQLRERFGYDPRDLRRSFGVEKKEFLLGEPILVRFAIGLAGTGKWRRDNWFYFNNRDETFLVLLRDENGKWIDDRYHPRESYRGGGNVMIETFSRKNPEIHWLPIQQYRSLTKTGIYDVFCFRLRESKSPSSPLLMTIPKDVIKQARTHPFAQVDFATDYAHFSIEIERGTQAQRTKMIRHWSKVGAFAFGSQHRDKSRATVRCWQYCLQNDFLPQLRSYNHIFSASDEKDRFALMYVWEESDRWEQKLLTRKDAVKLIPKLISDLTAKSGRSRSTALFHLREWTGRSLTRDWSGHKSDRPTPEESGGLQKRWRNWWKKNAVTFTSGQIQPRRAR